MTIKELQNYKKILILGYGTEGKASHDYLKVHVPEAVIQIADTSRDPQYLQKLDGYDLIIKTPGIAKDLVFPHTYTTATNIFFANVKGKTIGITGTKGKSTTSSIIHKILKDSGLKAHLVGNIGNSMLSELEISNEQDDIFVCELSSYQLDDCLYSPHIGVILNLYPDHMNYHKSVEAYYAAKTNIVRHMTSNDFFVYNPKHEMIVALKALTKAQSIPFIDIDVPQTSLLGEHMQDNIRAAITVADLFLIPRETAFSSIKTFVGLPHRMQNIGIYRDITFYDDGASVTPESTIASLVALPNVDTLLLGGQDRGYDFTSLVEVICNSSVRNIVIFPETGTKIKQLLSEKKPGGYNFFETTSMREAVAFAYKQSKSGSICLLSNASPSYSLWPNFVEKGREYQKMVRSGGAT